MARTSDLTNFLTDVATAIRNKKGYESSQKIPADEFDIEISSISTINNQQKTVNPTTSQQVIQPDANYTGLERVTINAVTSAIDNNIVAANIREDVTILGVTGTLEEGSDVSGVTATAGDVRETKKFVNSNGELLDGTFPDATAVYEEFTNSARLDTYNYSASNFDDDKVCYFDNKWYTAIPYGAKVYDGTTEITTPSFPSSSQPSYISVGCKDYFEENTVIIFLGYGNDAWAIGLYDYSNNILLASGMGFRGQNRKPSVNPYYPVVVWNSSSAPTMGALYTITRNGSSLSIASKFSLTTSDGPSFLIWDSTRIFGGDGIKGVNSNNGYPIAVSSDFNTLMNTSNDIGSARKHYYNNSTTKYFIPNSTRGVIEIYECSISNNGSITLGSTILYEIPNYTSDLECYFLGDNCFVVVSTTLKTIKVYALDTNIDLIATFTFNTLSIVSFDNKVFSTDNGIQTIAVGNMQKLVKFTYDNKSYLDTSNADATSGDILTNKTAFVNNQKVTGSMPNNGTLTITPSTSQQTIPAGYISGGTVAGDTNLVQANIKAGVTIFGVEGNLESDKPDQTKTITPSASQQVVEPDVGYELASVTVSPIPINVYAQTTEPIGKDGIWLKANVDVDEVITDDNVTLDPYWDTTKMSDLQAIPYNFYNGGFVAVGTDVYLIGGAESATTVCKYNTLTDTYTQLSNIPRAFLDTNVNAVGTDIYLFGGTSDSGAYITAYKYDTLTDTYTQLANVPYKFRNGAVVTIGTNLYLIGGYDNGDKNNLYKYNILTDTYTKLNNMPYSAHNLSACAIRSDIYIMGGKTNKRY